MTAHGRVIWSEGLFLRPQHFQQQDRCFELLVRESCQFFHPYFWGFRSLHHPEDLFRFFLGIAGELATFTTTSQRAGAFPAYDHDDLIGCFRPVEEAIRLALDWMREPTATSIPIEELQYGIRRAVIGDQALLASGTFVVEVSADMEADTLMKAFRAQSKFGPQDKIRELVVQALPGIPIRARMNAPRQIPYHVNAVYFEIDTGHDLWKGIEQTGILTLHVAGTFPNLAMTLWALKR